MYLTWCKNSYFLTLYRYYLFFFFRCTKRVCPTRFSKNVFDKSQFEVSNIFKEHWRCRPLDMLKPVNSSSLLDYAIPGSAEVPQRSEKEVGLGGPDAPPAGSVLHRCTPPSALHHWDENEEHVDAGKEQGRSRRDYLCTWAWVRGNGTSYMWHPCDTSFTVCPSVNPVIVFNGGAIL